jgi:hypothetical protein
LARVIVNGQSARIDNATGDWEIELPRGSGEIDAYGEDAAGNVEKLKHQIKT